MHKHIGLLKNNDNRDWEDIQWVEEFYRFLQGDLPEGIFTRPPVKLTSKQAQSIIYYLQEKLAVFPDHFEVCDVCGEMYDSMSQGHYSELTGKDYCCESCEPPRLYEREQRWEKRKDAPFQRFWKAVKKEQKEHSELAGREISEHYLRVRFEENLTPTEAIAEVLKRLQETPEPETTPTGEEEKEGQEK